MSKYEDYNPNIGSETEYNETDTLIYSDLGSQIEESRRVREISSRKEKREKGRSGRHQASRQSVKKAVRSNDGVTSFPAKVKRILDSLQMRLVIGIGALLLAAYLLVAFISYIKVGMADQSAVENIANGAATGVKNMGGEGGARISQFLINDTFGLGSVVIIFWLIWMSLKQFGVLSFKAVNYTIKCLVALITVSLIVGLMTIAVDSHFHWGGNHGYFINQTIIEYFGWIGAALLCVFMLTIFFVICINDVWQYFLRVRRRKRAEKEALEAKLAEEAARAARVASMQEIEDHQAERADDPPTGDPDDMVFNAGEQPEVNAEALFYGPEKTTEHHETQAGASASEEENPLEKDFDKEEGGDEKPDAENKADESGQEQTAPDVVTTSKGETMQVNVNDIQQAVDEDEQPQVYDPTAELSHFKFPPYNLLREAPAKISVDQDEQLENQEKIRETLADFGIEITSITATVGPTVTLYEIKPEKGVKIAKIRNLSDDIALSLSAKTGVRIIAPIPGKGTVGIEVANKDPQTVSMRTIVTSRAYQETRYELPMAIGSTINNQVYMTDLTKMPHLLVAGATGQGKSVGLNAIIASLLYSKHPAELKFVLIDPKTVEFSLYRKLERHYLAMIPGEENPIITSPEKVVATLSSLCVEMEDRYALLQKAGVRNIKEYNSKFIQKHLLPTEGHRFMPYIVVIVDEFADLIMTAGKEIELPIARLAQKARAIGIHVIIATQRPSTNVVTGIIKANFPARVAFKVSSGVDSKTILDTTGAQHLIGKGDMLISNGGEMERIQCAFIDTPEVTDIVKFISEQPGYGGPYELPEPIITGDSADGPSGGGSNTWGERDPLFDEIARLVVNSNTASTSSLQRRYSIGYNRAGKIMDQLEAAGIVGPAQGGKPRSVLVDPISLESILNSL